MTLSTQEQQDILLLLQQSGIEATSLHYLHRCSFFRDLNNTYVGFYAILTLDEWTSELWLVIDLRSAPHEQEWYLEKIL